MAATEQMVGTGKEVGMEGQVKEQIKKCVELMANTAAMVLVFFSSSSNCLGGNAGNGSSGAHGGPAGAAKVFVKEEDMDILIALQQPRVVGGRGGKAGKNGLPGSGGSGGAGGASHSWYHLSLSGLI